MSCRTGAYRTTGATLPREAGNFSTGPTHAVATLKGGKRWVSAGQKLTKSHRRSRQRTVCNRITLVREPPWVVGRGGAYRPNIDSTENGRGGLGSTLPIISPATGMSWVAFKNIVRRAPNGRICNNARTAPHLGRKWPAAVPTTLRERSGGGRSPRLDLSF